MSDSGDDPDGYTEEMPEDIILPTSTIQPEPEPSQSATEPANVIQVPNEILLHIISFASQGTRATLMRTNKRVYALAGPILYRRVSFSLRTKRTIFNGLPTRRCVPQLGSRIKKPPFNRKRDILKFVQVVDMDHQESDHRNFERVTGVNLQDMEYTLPSLRVVVSVCDDLGHFLKCSAFGSERLHRPVHFITHLSDGYIFDAFSPMAACTRYTTCRPSISVLEVGKDHSTRMARDADLVPQQSTFLVPLSDDILGSRDWKWMLRRLAKEIVSDFTMPSLVVGLECLGAHALTEASQTLNRSVQSTAGFFHEAIRDAAAGKSQSRAAMEGLPVTIPIILPVYHLMTFREWADDHASNDIVPAWKIEEFITRAEKKLRAAGERAW